MEQEPTFTEERRLWRQGYRSVAGIDEVGRGPLAGPVVAGAVILAQRKKPAWLGEVRDSKKLSPGKRELLAERIWQDGVAVGVGVVAREVIDHQGIVAATRMAMNSAVQGLRVAPDFIVIDALTFSELCPIPQKGIINGDNTSLSIAAASIVAKVHRDRLMDEYDRLYPGYGFAHNKGYGTEEHLEKLCSLGPCPIHRQSFAPVRDLRPKDGG